MKIGKRLLSSLFFLLAAAFVMAQSIAWEINEGRGPFIPEGDAPSIPIIISGLHGGAGGFEYANIPNIFGWRDAPLDEEGNLNFIQPSAISGFMTQLDFTYFQALVEITDPSKPFIIRYNSIDDGVIAYVFNETYPDGIEDPNGGVRLYHAPKETDLSPLLVAGRNRIVLVQFDDSWTENYLNVTVIHEEDVEEECPTYTIGQQGNNASCPSSNDGLFFVQASCPECNPADFSYSIDGGENFQAQSFFSGLAAGEYNVVVRNSAFPDCDNSFSTLLEANPDIESPTITACPENVSVRFNENGDGFINIANLTNLIEAEDNCSEVLDINVGDRIINIATEQIVAIVTDEAGNTSQCIINIIVEMPCNLFITGIDATLGDCPSLSESIIVSTNNSGNELEYSIDDINYQRSNVFGNVLPDFYRVFVREVENPTCVTSASITVEQGEDITPPEIILLDENDAATVLQSDTIFMVQCSDEAIGAWSARDNCDAEVDVQTSITNRTSEEGQRILDYQVTVTDNNGNIVVRTITFLIQDTEPPVLNCPSPADIITVNLDESGAFTPSADSLGVIATDNCSEVNYTFEPSTITTSGQTIITVTASDEVGNSAACTVSINIPEFLCDLTDVTPLVLPGACPDEFNAVELTALGSNAPLEYSLNGINYQTNNRFENIPPGVYLGFAREQNNPNCIVSIAVSISEIVDTEPPVLSCPSPADLITRTLDESGIFTPTADSLGISAIDNCSEVSYTFEPATITTVGQSEIMVTATDAAGNFAVCTVLVDIPAASCDLESASSSISLGTCPGDLGSIQLLAVVSTEILEYSINGVDYQLSDRFENITPGTYLGFVRELENPSCMVSTSITLEEVVDTESPALSCPNPADILVIRLDESGIFIPTINILGISATDNCSEVSYRLEPSEITESGEVAVLVTATDASGNEIGCEVLVNVEAACSLSSGSAIVSSGNCPGDFGSVQLIAFGSEEELEYSLDDINYQTSAIFEDVVPGDYIGYVRDRNDPDCIILIEITVGEGLDAEAPQIFGVLEDGTEVLLSELSFDCGQRPYQSLVVIDNCDPNPTLDSTQVLNETPLGELIVSLMFTVSDINGNRNTESYTFIERFRAPIDTTAVTIVEPCGPEGGSIDLSITGGVEPYTFSWSNGANTEDISDLEEGVYTVVISDQCSDSAEFSFTLMECGFLIGGNKRQVINSTTIYPNPVQNRAFMQLDLEKESNVEITVRSISGEALQMIQYNQVAAGQNKFDLDFSTFATGVYFVSVRTADTYKTTRVVVAK